VFLKPILRPLGNKRENGSTTNKDIVKKREKEGCTALLWKEAGMESLQEEKSPFFQL